MTNFVLVLSNMNVTYIKLKLSEGHCECLFQISFRFFIRINGFMICKYDRKMIGYSSENNIGFKSIWLFKIDPKVVQKRNTLIKYSSWLDYAWEVGKIS